VVKGKEENPIRPIGTEFVEYIGKIPLAPRATNSNGEDGNMKTTLTDGRGTGRMSVGKVGFGISIPRGSLPIVPSEPETDECHDYLGGTESATRRPDSRQLDRFLRISRRIAAWSVVFFPHTFSESCSLCLSFCVPQISGLRPLTSH
jgi:hypothetical protein